MPKNLLIVLVLLLTGINATAQDGDGKLYLDNRFMLKLTPTTINDREGAHILIGAEYLFDEDNGVALEVGVPLLTTFKARSYDDRNVNLHSDFRIHLEARHYYVSSRHLRLYLGGEGFFRRFGFSDSSSYYRSGYDVGTYFSSAKAVRTETWFGYEMGIMFKLSPRFYIEGMGSAGFKVITGHFYDEVNANSRQINKHYMFSTESRNMNFEGLGPGLYASLALKVGFLLGR